MCQVKTGSVCFNPGGEFVSASEAVKQVLQQPSPIDALMQVVRANVEVDEIGFASEVIKEYGALAV